MPELPVDSGMRPQPGISTHPHGGRYTFAVSIEPKVFVTLTRAGQAEIESEPLAAFTLARSMFPCASVSQDGYFLSMKVIWTDEAVSKVVDVSIPLHYVQAIVSAEAETKLGFRS